MHTVEAFQVLAARKKWSQAQPLKTTETLRIPEVTEPISDLQGLIRMAEILKEKGDSK